MNDSQRFTKTTFTQKKESRERGESPPIYGDALDGVTCDFAGQFSAAKGAAGIVVEFHYRYPSDPVSAGGIWPSVLGTIYLVVLSLLVAAPVGVMAGIYLNEYAKDNWLTRLINLAVINLAGVPSIVHALFGQLLLRLPVWANR